MVGESGVDVYDGIHGWCVLCVCMRSMSRLFVGAGGIGGACKLGRHS